MSEATVPPQYVVIQRNPRAGARQRRRELLALVRTLRADGFRPRMFRHRERLDAWMACEHRRARVRCLVAAGGDGTVNDLITRYPDWPIAVLPLGTENLLAASLGISQSGRAVARIVATGSERRFDIGLIGQRRFVMCAGVGLDAAVIHAVHDSRTGHITRWNYAWPILRLFLTYRPEELVLRDESGTEHRGRQILILNQPRYALGLSWAPDAAGDDGWLDVRVFVHGSLPWLARYLWRAWCHFRGRQSGVIDLRVRRATISSVVPVPVHVDGDPAGGTPVELGILPGKLRLVLPTAPEELPNTRSRSWES